MIGFAIGNGPSRKDFDLHRLDGKGLTVGCNWLFKDYSPDILVAIDWDVFNEIKKIESRTWKWMRRGKDRGNLYLEDEKVFPLIEVNRTVGKNSGIIACSYLAKKRSCERVYMVGFDFFRIHPGMKSNDIYHDHLSRYKNFHKAFNVLFEDCQDTQFIRVGPISEHDVEYFKVMEKFLTCIDYTEFEERIETNRL